MTDLISREDAIEAIKKEIQDFEANYMHDEDDEEYGHDIGFVAGLHRAKTFIRSLSSAKAETECIAQIKVDVDDEIVERIKEEYGIANKWIPCSDRLPEYRKTVLISTFWGVKTGYLDSTEAYGDFWEIIEDDGDTSLHNVYAWMPLPKPYREDGEA